MLRNIVLAGFVLSISIATAAGQAPQPETQQCNEDFARFLVEQQVAESRNVEQTDKRIRILVRAADFLWKFEEPLGREYFTEAFKVATDRYREKGFEKTEKKGLTTHMPDHRFEVIKAIAVKDAAWARRLIEQVLKDYEKDTDRKNYFDRTREIGDIVELAEKSIKTNPDFARSLLRRVMQHPLEFHWYWALFSIAQDDTTFSDRLYEELLANYANSTPRSLLFLSAYPFARNRIFGIERYQYGAYVPPGLTPNRDLQRQFIGTFLRRVVSFASDPENLNLPVAHEYHRPEPVYMVGALAELEPIIVQQHPAFIQQFSEAKALATGMLNDQMRKDMSEREKRNEELGYGFERRLKQLEEAETDGKLTDQMIVSLLTWGDDSKTEVQFKQIEPWLAKIQDEKVRYEAINYFWFLRSQLAVKERRLDDAERYAKKIPEIEHRAVLFFEIAEAQLKNVNDAATVYQTLRDVERMAEQAETSVEKARVLIALTNLYIKINPIFAMQELSDAIKVINRLESGDVLSTSVFRQIQGKNFSFFASFSMPGQDLEGTFKEISKNNFELSLSNAKSLEDKYLRTLAVLAVAQNCVGTVKKKPAPKKPAPRTGN
jgi:hypothetical protein